MKQRDRVGIVVLAAGGSQRMGQPKQLLPFGGRTLLRRAVETAMASTCRPIVVTIGAHEELLGPELHALPVFVAHNPDWAQGISSSLRVGVQALTKAAPSVEGALIMLADQPLVSAEDLDRLVAVHRETGKDIVASEYAGTRGVPVFIAAWLFEQATRLTGEAGGKSLIARYAEHVASVPLTGAATDIDTPADYERLAGADRGLSASMSHVK